MVGHSNLMAYYMLVEVRLLGKSQGASSLSLEGTHKWALPSVYAQVVVEVVEFAEQL